MCFLSGAHYILDAFLFLVYKTMPNFSEGSPFLTPDSSFSLYHISSVPSLFPVTPCMHDILSSLSSSLFSPFTSSPAASALAYFPIVLRQGLGHPSKFPLSISFSHLFLPAPLPSPIYLNGLILAKIACPLTACAPAAPTCKGIRYFPYVPMVL